MIQTHTPFFCSWSGGKDSCLSLYKAVQAGGIPKKLFTMFCEDGVRSRSHNLDLSIVKTQAASLGIPLQYASATWDDYEDVFIRNLHEIKKEGLDTGVFGDIDIDAHRDWVVRVCRTAEMEAIHPIWQRNRVELLQEFISLGFKALIVVLKDGVMDPGFLGRYLDKDTMEELASIGIDPCGENGEFHTAVVDGPIFKAPVPILQKERYCREGYWFLDIELNK